MNRGTLLAIVIVGLYLGFEAYTFNKVRYRMGPDYIYNLLVTAQAAAKLCGVVEKEPVMAQRFNKTLAREQSKYLDQLKLEFPETSEIELSKKLVGMADNALVRVGEQANSLGCESIELVAHIRQYKIYARRSR